MAALRYLVIGKKNEISEIKKKIKLRKKRLFIPKKLNNLLDPVGYKYSQKESGLTADLFQK